MSEREEFYLLSNKWTKKGDVAVTFWGPNDKGYRWRVEDFGRYTREQIEAMPEYYHNGYHTLAIPCGVVDALVADVKDGPTCVIRAVPNTAANLKKLRAAAFDLTTPEERSAA